MGEARARQEMDYRGVPLCSEAVFWREGESGKPNRNGEGSEVEICLIQLGHKNLKQGENRRAKEEGDSGRIAELELGNKAGFRKNFYVIPRRGM